MVQGSGVGKRIWVDMEAASKQENCWTRSVGFTPFGTLTMERFPNEIFDIN